MFCAAGLSSEPMLAKKRDLYSVAQLWLLAKSCAVFTCLASEYHYCFVLYHLVNINTTVETKTALIVHFRCKH